MATTVPTTKTTPTKRVPMDSLRKTALVAGGLYLVTIASSIPAVFLLAPVLDNPDYIISSGNDTRVLLGCFLDLINALACIRTAVALYPVVKRQNEGVALGFVTARMFEAAVIVIGVVSLSFDRDPATGPGRNCRSRCGLARHHRPVARRDP